MALLAALAHIGASFTYHSAYDDVLIAFLLIALGVARSDERERCGGKPAGCCAV